MEIKLTSHKQYFFRYLFSRNAKTTHRDQKLRSFFTLFELKRPINLQKLQLEIFSSVFVIDVICLDECFLSCVNCQNVRMTFSTDLKDLKSTKKLLIILFGFHYFYCISYRKCAKLSPSTARRSCSQMFLKIMCS